MDATYHGDDFVLDSFVQGDKAKVETEVKLRRKMELALHSGDIPLRMR